MAEEIKKKKVTEAFGFEGGDMLKKILAKHPSGITDEEKAVLFARRSYLTEQQRKDYGIKGKPPTSEAEESEGTEESEGPKLEEMSLKELRKLAKEKKIKVKRGSKEADIIVLLKEKAEFEKAEAEESEGADKGEGESDE